jgi:SAM-dependent methyltransferase
MKPFHRPPPLPEAGARLSIINTTLERHQPGEKFDLVTCLNVVDRHPYPRTLIGSIANVIAEGGLLVISCPFDFRIETTPDRGDWIDDLNDLFAHSGGWESVGEAEVYYEFRSSSRKWTRFATQVVCMRWHA